MDEETKRLVCRMIAGLVASDEDFEDSERAFLDKVLKQFGIPEEEWDAIFPLEEAEEAGRKMAALEATAQKEGFELLMEAALADGKIVDEEVAYISAVGRAIGLSDDTLQARLKGA